MNERVPGSLRIRRPVQRHLPAAIERIESLHLGGIHRSSPESALQASRDAEQPRRDSCHPDLRETLDLRRAWDPRAPRPAVSDPAVVS